MQFRGNTKEGKIMEYTLGIDIGSTTVKVALLNDTKELLYSDYQRHHSNIKEALSVRS